MFCSKCGFELLEGSEFCSQCGERIGAAQAEKSDAELEHLAATGDSEAFGILYLRHSDSLHDHLARLLRDPEEAQDIVHDAFERALRALKPGKKEASFRTWLFVIADRLALKRIQRGKRIVAPPSDDAGAPLIFDQVDPDRLGQPEAAAEAREMAGLVWEAAAGLSPKEYALLDLNVRQGLESAEIAQVLGVSKGNAYTMISRLKGSFESAVAGLYMLRYGRRDCPELDFQLRQLSMTEYSPAARRIIQNHVKECPNCQERQRKLVSPVNILGSFAAVPLPFLVKQRIGEALAASAAHAGAHAAGVGLKGLLSQFAAKVSGLSTTWKAAIVGTALVVATGGGLGTYVALTGGLPGSGGGPAENGVPVMATPGPGSSAVPVAPTPRPTHGSGKIVFRSNRDTPDSYIGGIYIMDADGGDIQAIGTGGASYERAFDSGLSPDGTRSAFYKCADPPLHPNNWSTLYVQNLDGSGQIPLATYTVRCQTDDIDGGFSWSPDSSRIVVYRGGDDPGLYVVNADGTEVAFLARGIFPQWSPDGDLIVFMHRSSPAWQCEVRVIEPDGSGERVLAQVPCEGDASFMYGPRPQWSPDGSMLAFSANPSQPRDMQERLDREVFVLGADGSGPTNLTNGPSDDYDPIWVNCNLPTAGCEARVTNIAPDTLNLRQDASSDAQVVGALSEGDTVCLVGAPAFVGGYRWWPVSTADGKLGWAAAFDPKDPSKPWLTPTGNACREAPGTRTGGQVPVVSCRVSKADLPSAACAQDVDNNLLTVESATGEDMVITPDTVSCQPEFRWSAKGYQTCSADSCDPYVCATNMVLVKIAGEAPMRARISVTFSYRLELHEGYASEDGDAVGFFQAYPLFGDDCFIDIWPELRAYTLDPADSRVREEEISRECEISFQPGDTFEIDYNATASAGGQATFTLEEVDIRWLK
jgi:RNA polymerase sigma factor (sigma-70 family)